MEQAEAQKAKRPKEIVIYFIKKAPNSTFVLGLFGF
jgi:hypothetical protein